jgi:hypothetical protein
MKSNQWRYIVGGALILLGILAFLDSFLNVSLTGLFWAVLFLAGGGAFFVVLAGNSSAWWAVIPGFTLASIGALIGLDSLLPSVANYLGGAIVLGGIGCAFLTIYLMRRMFWWALIPMGTMFSLVLLILLDPFIPGGAAWIFLLGLAGTFAGLMLVKDGSEPMRWPIYPAISLLAVSMIVMMGTLNWAAYIWPLILILAGGFLVVRALTRKAF